MKFFMLKVPVIKIKSMHQFSFQKVTVC